MPDGTGRFALDGRWPFASGCRHAEWFLTGMFVFDGDAPRLLADRGPDWRLAFLRREDAEIVDNWDVLGLRATGSNDIVVRALSVAEEHTISPFFETAQHDGPLWRLTFFSLVRSLWPVSRSGSRGARSTSSSLLRQRRCAPGRRGR